MFLLNPVIAMIHNTPAGSWHPVIFEERPLPGPPAADKPTRHKSKGHHTAGFATRQEALDHIETDLAPRIKALSGSPRLALGGDISWNGQGVPAAARIFEDHELTEAA